MAKEEEEKEEEKGKVAAVIVRIIRPLALYKVALVLHEGHACISEQSPARPDAAFSKPIAFISHIHRVKSP